MAKSRIQGSFQFNALVACMALTDEIPIDKLFLISLYGGVTGVISILSCGTVSAFCPQRLWLICKLSEVILERLEHIDTHTSAYINV